MEVPPEFFCPLSLEIMVNPVLVPATGQTYERAMIEAYLQRELKDPLQPHTPLQDATLSPNHALRNAIERFMVDNQDVAERLAQLDARVQAARRGGGDERMRSWLCPITRNLMRDPVRANDGLVYGKLQLWLCSVVTLYNVAAPRVAAPRVAALPRPLTPLGLPTMQNAAPSWRGSRICETGRDNRSCHHKGRILHLRHATHLAFVVP
jgi:hypothetical protein